MRTDWSRGDRNMDTLKEGIMTEEIAIAYCKLALTVVNYRTLEPDERKYYKEAKDFLRNIANMRAGE